MMSNINKVMNPKYSKSKCHMTLHFNAGTRSRANVLYNSLRVDAEPKTVIRELAVDDSTLIINLSSESVSNLRASSNSVLENLKTLSDVIEKFEISEEYSYSYFGSDGQQQSESVCQ